MFNDTAIQSELIKVGEPDIPKIHNVVTTADLRQHVEATKFNYHLWGRYDVENNYNGKVGYVKDDKMQGRVTVFISGKMISTGAKSILKSIEQLEHTMDLLVSNNFIIKENLEPKVRNVVATTDLKTRINIDELSQKLHKPIYEPEQFPGLIYKTKDGPTCLIFASGKVVITGANSEDQLNDTASSIRKELHQFQ